MSRLSRPAVRLALVGLVVAILALATLAVGFYPRSEASSSGGAMNTAASQEIVASVPMDLQAQLSATSSGCSNAPGPVVTLSGAMALGGLGTELLFENNLDGTHQYTVESTATAIVIPAGDSISIPKQPVDGGTGGNPWIWMEWTDPNGNALTSPVFLGRCVQGLFADSAALSIPSTATAIVQADSCSNTGSTISLSGQLSLSGLNVMLMFANSNNPVDGPHSANVMASANVVVLPAGHTITFQKQPSMGGVGGNPWVFLEFQDANGDPVSQDYLLGRCVQDL